MRNRIAGKLKSNSGESIAETLVAVLIAAFALLMLAGTINTASNLITNSKAKLKTYYEGNNKLASGSAVDADRKATVSMVEPTAGKEITIGDVSVYENNKLGSMTVIAYRK